MLIDQVKSRTVANKDLGITFCNRWIGTFSGNYMFSNTISPKQRKFQIWLPSILQFSTKMLIDQVKSRRAANKDLCIRFCNRVIGTFSVYYIYSNTIRPKQRKFQIWLPSILQFSTKMLIDRVKSTKVANKDLCITFCNSVIGTFSVYYM